MIQKLLQLLLHRFIEYLTLADLQHLDTLIHRTLYAKVLKTSGTQSHYVDRKYWELLANEWHRMPLPVRPSSDDIAFYERGLGEFAANRDSVRLLILGATPELRNMAARNKKIKVYIADLSFQHIIRNAFLGDDIDTEREIWIKENWLHLPIPDHFFDIIVGDLVLQQVRPEEEEMFMQETKRLLKKDGICFLRLHYLDIKCTEGSIESAVEEIIQFSAPKREKLHALKMRVLWMAANLPERHIDRRKAYESICKYIDAKGKWAELLMNKENMEYYKTSHRNWSPPDLNGLTELLQKHFRQLDLHISSDYIDAKYYPLYILTPK